MVFNIKPTREWLSREDNSYSTSSLEAIFLTETIDAYKGRHVMVLYVTNTLINTNIPPNKYGEERVTMKIKCVLVDMLLELDREKYSKHVVF